MPEFDSSMPAGEITAEHTTTLTVRPDGRYVDVECSCGKHLGDVLVGGDTWAPLVYRHVADVRTGEVAALTAELAGAIENEKNAIALAYQYRSEVERLTRERDAWKREWRIVADEVERMRPYAQAVTRHLECEPHDCRCGIDTMDAYRVATSEQEANDA